MAADAQDFTGITSTDAAISAGRRGTGNLGLR
jgi:hypothetical protein